MSNRQGRDSVVLAAQRVARTFRTARGPLTVLNGVDLTLSRGDFACIVGASGVGKSTLLHILGGLDRPTEGTVQLGAESLVDRSETDLARLRVEKLGFVFQFHYLLEDFTARENVMVPLILAGQDRREAGERAEGLLQEVGLAERMTHRPRELSGGEQQRVAVARALANEPELVLADEPTGNLDTATAATVHELLEGLAENGRTTFLVATHNRDLADRCQRRLTLSEGKLHEETATN